MLRLMLLRHAKSSWPSGTQDAERPLSERGEAAARLMGSYIAHHALFPDAVLCSPARRTRDTWTGLCAAWPGVRDPVFDARLYGATRPAIVSIVREAGVREAGVREAGGPRTLLVIGHNPGLQEAAEFLIAAGDVELRERLREKFPTAALAVIDFTADTWDEVHARSGRLDRYVTPRSVAAATA